MMSTWDRLKAIVDGVDAERAEAARQVELLQREIADLATVVEMQKARIAELEAQLPSAPPASRTLFGACPNNAAPKNAQSVVNRFGPGAHVRSFLGAISEVAQRPVDAGGVAVTWNHGGSYASRPTIEQYASAARNLRPGDVWERQHESDKKVRDGVATFDQAAAALIDFARKAKQARPDLLTMMTTTGWLFSPNPSAPGLDARNQWGPVAAEFDILGIDLDGVHTTPPPDYRRHRPNWEAFMERFGIERLAVPELGTRLNQAGMTEAARVDWWLDQAGFLAELGYCVFVDAFLWDMNGNQNDMTAREVAAWSDLIASTR